MKIVISHSKSDHRQTRRIQFLAPAVCTILSLLGSAYAAAPDFSGKWSGSAPGNDAPGTVYAVLKQEGAKLSGSAGPSASKQFPITLGKVSGDHLAFEVTMGGGTIHFDLSGTVRQISGSMQIIEDDGHTATAHVALEHLP